MTLLHSFFEKARKKSRLCLYFGLAVVILVVAAVLFTRVTSTTGSQRSRAVIQTVVDYCVNESGWPLEDPVRLVAIEGDGRTTTFVVTRGAPGSESPIASGEFDDLTFEMRPLSFSPATAVELVPADEMAVCYSRRPKESWLMSSRDMRDYMQNIQGVVDDEDVRYEKERMSRFGHGIDLRARFLWHYGIQNGWFKPDDTVLLLFIARWSMDDSLPCAWYFTCELAYGMAPTGNMGGSYVDGDVDLNTLEIEGYISE